MAIINLIYTLYVYKGNLSEGNMPPLIIGGPTIINIGGFGGGCYPPPPGMCIGRGPLFGWGFPMSRSWMFYRMNSALAAGYSIGVLGALGLSCPDLGKALAWPFQQLWKGATWLGQNVIKPVAQWVGDGVKKSCKSVKKLFTKKKNKDTKTDNK